MESFTGWFTMHKQPAMPKLSPAEKLLEYHRLAKDALNKAFSHDEAGDGVLAKRDYQTGIAAAEDGLALQVATSGLGPSYSTVDAKKAQLSEWREAAAERLQELENGTALRCAPVVRQHSFQPTAAQPRAPQRRQQPANGGIWRTTSAPTKPAPRPVGASSSGMDAKLRDVILAEVLDTRPSVRWDDVAGLAKAKQALREMVILPAQRPELFKGLRAPARGLLLYGPPGNGKTMLAKALAREAECTFFNISASSLTSKWHGEAEKLVRALFAVAAERSPSIIFIDEIDSILSERSAGEHEASRRLKTQFLVEFDGVANGGEQITVIGATNRPQELDDAVRRRLVKRIYIPMPDDDGRMRLLKNLLQGQPVSLSRSDYAQVVQATELYSGSDLAALCREAAIIPIRELGSKVSTIRASDVRPLNRRDVEQALGMIRPSVSRQQLAGYEAWTQEYGTL